MPLPGGCAIGARPVDLHLEGFRRLGATVKITEEGTVVCETSTRRTEKDPETTLRNPLVGAGVIEFRFPSVGATHAVMIAAALAEGVTVLRNAASEPEIADLAAMLNAAGADITGAGSSTVTIRGVGGGCFEERGVPKAFGDVRGTERVSSEAPRDIVCLSGCRHRAIPDRIEAGTFLVAAAVTHSALTVEPVIIAHVRSTMDVLERAGCAFEVSAMSGSAPRDDARKSENVRDARVRLKILPPDGVDTKMRCVDFVTAPYPGVPTDMQPQLCVLSCVGEGESSARETVFESRFSHARELRSMGVCVRELSGNEVSIRGSAGGKLIARDVTGSDLRATAALVLAGLCAEGTTRVAGLKHLDRGYEGLEAKLNALGAKIKRREM
jgi:UDP-N-acetylglucosamine 1-carboxyvinyltransferase